MSFEHCKENNMDILNLLEDKFGNFRLTNNDNEIRFNCIYCSDTGFHLYCNTEKNVLHCFRCGKSESLVKIFGKYLQNYKRIPVQKQRTFPKMDGVEPLEGANTYLSKLAIQYLKSRRITNLTSIYYGVSLSWFGRVVFPIIEDGKIVVATGRAFISGINPKYFNQGDKSRYIYLLEERKYSPYIILCEGCTDALSCQNGVALMGKELSKFQLYKLYLTVPPEKPIFLALDPDAKREGLDIARRLSSHYTKVYFCNLPEGRDMNDLRGKWEGYPYYQITENNFIKMSQNILGM